MDRRRQAKKKKEQAANGSAESLAKRTRDATMSHHINMLRDILRTPFRPSTFAAELPAPDKHNEQP